MKRMACWVCGEFQRGEDRLAAFKAVTEHIALVHWIVDENGQQIGFMEHNPLYPKCKCLECLEAKVISP